MQNLLFKDGVKGRHLDKKKADQAALNAIVQAAVNVELFTIPLYMASAYSLQGTHQINGQNNLYQGRHWPGMSTSAKPETANQKAFNAIFSVMIAEMLHLELAANISSVVQRSPSFNSPALQNDELGWTCYGPDNTVIPHIIDLKDMIAPYDEIKVNLGAVNKEQIDLFLVIEETEALSAEFIKPDKLHKYFPTVPFPGWTEEMEEKDLPLFGSIGSMYYCLWEYISLEYTDGSTLWDTVYSASAVQEDLFNSATDPANHEYPELTTTFSSTDDSNAALAKLMDMINGITDQGEGHGVVAKIKKRLHFGLQAVEKQYQPDKAALENNYPSYNDKGDLQPDQSADAEARSHYGSKDHYETFQDVMALVKTGDIVTWDQWHADPTNKWEGSMLETEGKTGPYNDKIPSGNAIATALNNLKNDPDGTNYKLFSQTATGSIAGVTTVLNTYWSTPGSSFPYPAMSGTGDRMAICWAIFGKVPNLGVSIPKQDGSQLYNACQGLIYEGTESSTCASVAAYHTCKGSNNCMTQGGCGFIQTVDGGSGCGSGMAMLKETSVQRSQAPDQPKVEGTCSPIFYSTPGDNRCKTFGGCAVPISASQLFPAPPAKMTGLEYYDFPENTPEVVDRVPPYTTGTPVYDVAWEAYSAVMEKRTNKETPVKPLPVSDIRLAFPPST